MLVTEFGIVMLVKLEQLLNAYAIMLVTEFGIVTLVKLEQPSNAESPIVLVTKLVTFHLNVPKITRFVGEPEYLVTVI